MIKPYFAVPMIEPVLNPLNTRLDAANIAFSLMHGSAKVLIVDAEYAPLVRQALQQVDREIVVIDIASPDGTVAPLGKHAYEGLLAAGHPNYDSPRLTDE